MTHIKVPGRADYVRDMFGQISGRYDLMNRLISLGRDRSWRRYAVRKAAPPQDGRLLDVGSGTGDIALEALLRYPGVSVTAVDFSLRMLMVGRKRPAGRKLFWCSADALELPFPDATFDSVTSGYLVRNVKDVRQAFAEQMRVVKPGGSIVCLDTSPIPKNLMRIPVLFYLKIVIPLLGLLIAGNRAAYMYLPKSTQAFMTPEQLASHMRSAGLQDISYRRFMLGTMAVHTGIRPIT
jgi:demethylmenaquinone methyltransferase/2-methoxy-6-polyprenyl-1,4-benzoquinol methylase